MNEANSFSGWDGGYDSTARIVILADNEQAQTSARDAASQAGYRIGRVARLSEAADVFDEMIAVDAIFVNLDGVEELAAGNALAASSRRAAQDGLPVIVATPFALLDQALTWDEPLTYTVLVDPAPEELLANLKNCLAPDHRLVSDVASEMDAIRLQRLADEVARIAKALSGLTGLDGGSSLQAGMMNDAMIGFRAAPVAGAIVPAPDSSEIRAMIRMRRLRERFFGAELFADPAWDMLLDLTAARIEQVQVAVSSLCIAAAVPPTTALRWIKAMTDQGMFERCADPDDGRRIFIRLSDHAANSMYGYFAALKRQGGVAV